MRLNGSIPLTRRYPTRFRCLLHPSRRYGQRAQAADFGVGQNLSPDQVDAVIDGLGSRVQLLQGPPGTGKTQTTATAVLARTAARLQPGALVLIAANTHTAVDTLARRIYDVARPVREALEANGVALPPVRIAKVHSSDDGNPIAPYRDRHQRCTVSEKGQPAT